VVDYGRQKEMDMDRISAVMKPCSHCRQELGFIAFPGLPGVFCVGCTREIRKLLDTEGQTLAELLAEYVRDPEVVGG